MAEATRFQVPEGIDYTRQIEPTFVRRDGKQYAVYSIGLTKLGFGFKLSIPFTSEDNLPKVLRNSNIFNPQVVVRGNGIESLGILHQGAYSAGVKVESPVGDINVLGAAPGGKTVTVEVMGGLSGNGTVDNAGRLIVHGNAENIVASGGSFAEVIGAVGEAEVGIGSTLYAHESVGHLTIGGESVDPKEKAKAEVKGDIDSVHLRSHARVLVEGVIRRLEMAFLDGYDNYVQAEAVINQDWGVITEGDNPSVVIR